MTDTISNMSTVAAHPARTATTLDPIIPRLQAFAAAGWSGRTGRRREKSDPRMPAKVAIGHMRYGYRASEWAQYLAGMPTAPANPTPDPARVDRARAAARGAVAKRKERAALKAAAL